MNWFIQLFTEPTVAQAVIVYSLVIASGIALGKIKILGISFGITWVLFVGLIISYFGIGFFCPRKALPGYQRKIRGHGAT